MRTPIVFAVDPGTAKSGVVIYDSITETVRNSFVDDNLAVLGWVKRLATSPNVDLFAAETFQFYGPQNPIGKSTIESVFWLGRFYEAWADRAQEASMRLLKRPSIKAHLCGTAKANDAAVRAALIQRLGKDATKDVKSHEWSALAVAVVAADIERVFGGLKSA